MRNHNENSGKTTFSNDSRNSSQCSRREFRASYLHQMQQARTELSLKTKPDEDNKQVNSIFGEQHKKSSYNRVINQNVVQDLLNQRPRNSRHQGRISNQHFSNQKSKAPRTHTVDYRRRLPPASLNSSQILLTKQINPKLAPGPRAPPHQNILIKRQNEVLMNSQAFSQDNRVQSPGRSAMLPPIQQGSMVKKSSLHSSVISNGLSVDSQMMGGKKILINNNGSMVSRPSNLDGISEADQQKMEQLKEREGRVRMREALGFDANPAEPMVHEGRDRAPPAEHEQKRRSRTSNKDREERQKLYEDLVGEFSERQLEIFARSNFDPDREFGDNAQSQDVTNNVIQRATERQKKELEQNGHLDKEGQQLAIQKAQQLYQNRKALSRNPTFIKNIYSTIEKEFDAKKRFSERDWMAKNTQEKPQTFRHFLSHVRNWDINECIIYEMWQEQDDPELQKQEKNFQKMLVNNMESVFKIFFRGMSTVRVKSKNEKDNKGNGLEQSLTVLEKQKVVQTRIRPDTKVKQFHAGQIFDYLKSNIQLQQNQCLLVLTNADLYPKDGWTFVFGMTKQSWRICIQSYARHHPNFAHEDKPMRNFTSKIARKVQYRAIKTACHELAHVLSIRHCQAYECLMNGSSQLEEADQKPFALCPVCLRKMSSYLGFNGEELELFTELKDVFKLMNHNDSQQNFKREIRLFDRIQKQLIELYNNANENNNWSAVTTGNNEGGAKDAIQKLEQKQRLLKAESSQNYGQNEMTIIKQKDNALKEELQQPTDSASDITQKQVSEIVSGQNHITMNELRGNRNGSAAAGFCSMIVNCFNCFNTNEDEVQDYQRGPQNRRKNGSNSKNISNDIEKGNKKLPMGQMMNTTKQNNQITDIEKGRAQNNETPVPNVQPEQSPIYQMDSDKGIQKVSHRNKKSSSSKKKLSNNS